MSLQIAAVCTAIKGLIVTGLVIRDLDEIPETTLGYGPIIFPRPDGFVSGMTRERQGFGPVWEVRYTLNYRLCAAPVGAERGLFNTYPIMIALAFAFEDAILAIPNGSAPFAIVQDIDPRIGGAFGPVADPAGALYHGCDFEIEVTEYVGA